MKRKVALTIVLICLLNLKVSSQSTQAVNVVNKITLKLRDSLDLPQAIADKLYQINIELSRRKQAIWKKHSGSDKLNHYLQQEENRRDSLYNQVLPGDKFTLYKTKKHDLIQAGD